MKGDGEAMARRHNETNSKRELNREEWSEEQRKHWQENKQREDEPIDNRKIDGPNYPAT